MRSKLLVGFVLAALLLALVGAAAAQGPALSGEIDVYPQNYYNPESDPETAAVMEEIAQAYMDLHPGVTINLIPNLPAGTNYDTWLAARIAAGEAPDIAWEQFYSRNTTHAEWWVPLNDYFEMPNPYIEAGTPGSERWMDSFPDYVMNQTRAADGNWYQVSLDWVETALYCNTDLFDAAGIEMGWDDWASFVADMTALRDATGADPIAAYMAATGWSIWVWADDVFLSAVWADMASELMMEEYTALQPDRDFRQLNPEEIARAIIDGTLNATDPRMDEYLRISLDFVSLLPVDYTGITTYDDAQRLFLSEQAACFWGGTWSNKQIEESAPFAWTVTYLPPFTENDFPGAPGTAYRVGGPSSAGQYGIPVRTQEEGKLDLAVDFLMYLAAPQNFGRLAATYRAFIPMVAGTEGGAVVENFAGVAALPERLFTDPAGRLTAEAGDQWATVMQGYFLGTIDAETAKAQLQDIWMNGALALCADQGYDWCPAQ